MNPYADVLTFARMQLNNTPTIAASDKIEIARILNATSRSIDDKAGRYFYTQSKVRYMNGNGARTLDTLEDIVSLSEVAIDVNGDGSYSLVLDGDGVSDLTDFDLLDPDRDDPFDGPPYRMIRCRRSGQLPTWPRGERMLRLTGVFGYKATAYSVLDAAGAAVATTFADTVGTALALSLTPSYPVAIGMTLLVDSEQLYVRDAVSATAFVVDRGVNGTTPAVHTAAALSRVTYPDTVVQATIMQAARLWARRQTPLWPNMIMQAPGLQTEILTQGLDPDITDMLVPVRLMRGAM